MFLVAVLEIKIRIVTGTADLGPLDFSVVRATHCLGEADQLRFFAADRPIVAITAERNDPLLGIGLFKQHMQPAFKPRPRSERPRRIDVRSLIEKRSDEPIDVVRKLVEIDVLKLLTRLNGEPKFLVVVVERVAKLVDERSNVFFVNRIDLFPVDHDTSGFRVAQRCDHVCEKALLSIRRPVRQIFDRLRLPRVAD